MIGSDLLVAPILKPDVTRRLVYLPAGTWYAHWTNKKYLGGTMVTVDGPLDTVPMFVRGGAMIPTTTPQNYVGEKPAADITFNIYPDERGSATGNLYEDDGMSPAYKHGRFRRTIVSGRRENGAFSVFVDSSQGQFSPGIRRLRFAVKGEGSTKIREGKT